MGTDDQNSRPAIHALGLPKYEISIVEDWVVNVVSYHRLFEHVEVLFIVEFS